MKLYIAVLEDVPDYITPTLVAHAVLGALEVNQVVRNPMLKQLNWSTPYMSIYFTNQKEPCAWVDESYGEAFVLPKLEKV